MSLDLYERETAERMRNLPAAPVAEVGLFDGFIRGTGLYTMRGLAKTARAIDVLGAVGPIAQDAFTGGTEAQDRYFSEHDEVFGSAVDYWTPKPREVGAAAEIAGALLSTLPMVLAAPSLAVGSLQLSVAEDLVKKGVDPTTAQLVGASQAAGLGLGIYMPIFGQTLTQRVLAGGVGFNVVQGIGMRAAGEALLEGTPAEGEYLAFDPTALTLDVLLGAAFGGITHLSPSQRAQGAETWKKIEDFAKGWRSSDVDALAALRQVQHLNADSMPGKPIEPADIERHTQRLRTALEQVLRGEPVEVSDLPAPRFELDEAKWQDTRRQLRELGAIGEEVRKAENLPPSPTKLQIQDGENLTPEQRAVEAKARNQVEQDIEGQIRDYAKLPDSENGKILNVDVARELFPEYRDTRWLHSPSVHEPASALVKELYGRLVTQPDPLGLNMVTFTAGGTGAGKTSALNAVGLARNIVGASQLVYDTNLSGFRSAAQKIDLALANDKRVNILYVATDPVQAFGRMLKRAMRPEPSATGGVYGRTVPLAEHIKTHQGAAATLEMLMDQYRGNDKVQFVLLDNTVGAKGKVGIIEPGKATEFLRSIDFQDLEPRLKEILDAERKAGRITEQIYRGVAGALTGETGPAPRPGGPEGAATGGGPGRAGGTSQIEAVEPERQDLAPIPAATALRGAQPPELEAPAALRGEAAPPPRGPRAEAAGAEGIDPLRFEAERFVAANPDLLVRTGQEADGTPIMQTAREYLDQAKAAAADAREDIGLFEAAAVCLFGRA